MRPPQRSLAFLRWFCREDCLDEIEGDLTELFRKNFGRSPFRARWKFTWSVLRYFRPQFLKPLKHLYQPHSIGMYASYFKIGWRNLFRSKGYSIINIGGLALGMAVAMLMGLWIWDELTFNAYHENHDRLAQVLQHQTVDGKVLTGYAVPRPLENALRDSYGDNFSHLAMASWPNHNVLSWGEQNLSVRGSHVQPDFPEMMTLKMVSGSRGGLKDPYTVMLSASTARALFGDADPLRQTVRLGNRWDVEVTGVYEDIPYHSSFQQLKFLATWELFVSSQPWVQRAAAQWDNNSFNLFAMLAPGADMAEVSEKIKPSRAIHSGDPNNTYKPEIFLHPMNDWRLRSNWENGVKTGGQIEMVRMVGIIGLFVLVLACINFMNLTTAKSEKRAKEVGIRMAVGSARTQLVSQFMTETVLVVLLSFVLALGLVVLSMPWFNDLARKSMTIQWGDPAFWSLCLGFVAVTSLLAGSYPAFFLSSFRPVRVLKGTYKAGKNASLPRKVLVIAQFTVSIALVIGTLVIYDQVQHTKNRPVGYDQENMIMIQIKSGDFTGKYEALRQELKNTGMVVEESVSSSPITQIWSNSSGFSWPGKNPDEQSSGFGTIYVSYEYGATLGWQVKEGRDFSRDFPSDSAAIILNEAAVQFMGLDDAVGTEVTSGDRKYHVVGVVEDMIMESPFLPVRQNIYFLDKNYRSASWIHIKLNPDRPTGESIAAAEAVFKKFAPSVPFDYLFVDAEYGRKFVAEEQVGTLAYLFSGLAVFISCLGLIGLTSFVVEQRAKEIGIRKVLGASVVQLMTTLSSSFMVLITFSIAAAVPIAYFVMSQWLERYPYRVGISWEIIALSVAGALLVTLATVSIQAMKAAWVNPLDNLRSE